MPVRSAVYVDGFNLYYGALKGTPYRWLNLEKLFRKIRQDDDLQRIYYFTALVDNPPSKDQSTYFAALGSLPLLTIVPGRFKTREVRCRVKECPHTGNRLFRAPEEKRTDVNIALQMLDDAYQDTVERFVLVSGDSDLVPVLEMIRKRFPRKKLILYVPAPHNLHIRAAAVELRASVDKHVTLPMAAIKKSLFPDVVYANGSKIEKPRDW